MGLLATDFDEEKFKRGYGKVCYEYGLKDGIKIGEEKGQKVVKCLATNVMF